MMNLFHLSLRGTLLTLLVLAVSCASPLANLVTGKAPSALPPLGPGETRLVFSTGGNLNESRLIATDGYMTIQLRSQADGTTKFATSTGSAGTYSVTISGLVAGLWNLKVMLYDNQTTQTLLHYGSTQKTIVPGIDNPVSIDLYVPGTISGVSLGEAKLVDHVTITAQEAATKFLPMGTVWDLDATAYSNSLDAQNNPIPATQPAVTWSSDREDLAWVSSTGRVTVVKPSADTITITAASVEDPTKTDTYTIIGVPAVWGNWKWTNQNGAFSVVRFTETGYETFDGNVNGFLSMGRGTYTFLDGVLQMNRVDRLDLTSSPIAWVTETDNVNGPDVSYLRVTPTSIELVKTESPTSSPSPSPSPSPQPVTSPSNADNGPKLYLRIDSFIESTGVIIPNAAGSFSMGRGDSIHDYIQALDPANATVPVMVWESTNPSVLGYGPNGFQGLALGPAIIKAYSPTGATLSPVATYTVTVIDNKAPVERSSTISSSYSSNYSLNVYVQVSDADTGINPTTITITPNPSGNDVATGVTASLSSYDAGTGQINISLYTGAMTGSAQIRIVVSDNAGNPLTVTKDFSVY